MRGRANEASNLSAGVGRVLRSLTASDAGRGAGRGRKTPSLVGIDMAPELRGSHNRLAIPLIATAILAALLLVGLRIDLIRMQYATADSGALEQELLDERQALTVEMRRLRDPSRLVEHAGGLGFERPERVIDLRVRRLPEVATGTRAEGSQP